MSELKPCPLCGGEAEILEVYEGYFFVQCKNEDCFGDTYDSAEEAKKAWNRRNKNV